MRAVVLALAFGGGLIACASETLLQGDGYEPGGMLPIDAPTRRDAGTAAPDASTPTPTRDGGTDASSAAPSNTCDTARDIGTVDGDDGTTTATTDGTCATYVKVLAVESSSSAIGHAMNVRITLSPQAHDFDLYAFFDPTSAAAAICTKPPFARSETNGITPETIDLSWGEGSVSNGADDSRSIVLAVTSPTGPCPTGASWTLTVRGNP